MQQFDGVRLILLWLAVCQNTVNAFSVYGSSIKRMKIQPFCSQQADVGLSIDGATELLSEWDRRYNLENFNGGIVNEASVDQSKLPDAVKLLNRVATEERNADSTKGR